VAARLATASVLARMTALTRSTPMPAERATRVGWIGLAAIGVSTVGFGPSVGYPGMAALLPTLGAAAVIAAGARPPLAPRRVEVTARVTSRRSARRAAPDPLDRSVTGLLGHPALREIGRLSYAWYLWHWPLLVLVEAATGPLAWPIRLLVVLAAGLPAWATLELVEDRLRFAALLVLRPRISLAVGAAAMCVPLLVGLLISVLTAGPAQTAAAAAAAATPPSATDPFDVAHTPGRGDVTPAPAAARGNSGSYPSDCQLAAHVVQGPPCMLGTPVRGHVVLLGDSHAAQWESAVQEIARRRGWGTEMLVKGGCPLPTLHTASATASAPTGECDTWRENVLRRIETEPGTTMIFISSMNRYTTDAVDVLAGWRPVLPRLAALKVPVVYLRDTPYPGYDIAACMSGALSDWSQCTFPRATGLPPDPLALMIRDGSTPGVRMVDLTPLICPPTGADCPAALGRTLLYRDASHLTDTAILRLVPALEQDLDRQHLIRPPDQ
jgi:hypothetical protein